MKVVRGYLPMPAVAFEKGSMTKKAALAQYKKEWQDNFLKLKVKDLTWDEFDYEEKK